MSRFDHNIKRPREVRNPPWRCVNVYEPGYPTNVGYRRLLSHAVFDLSLPFCFAREVLRAGRPDVILAALPHNGGAVVTVVFARAARAVSILDVHDTWPESLRGVTSVGGLRSVPFRFWQWMADFAYRRADQVFAESTLYAARANAVRAGTGLPAASAIYLGGDLRYYQGIPAADALPPELEGVQFIVAYAGTMGRNNDLDCVLEAFARFSSLVPGAGLMFLGAGEREEEVRSAVASGRFRGWVSGRLPHPTLVSYLKRAQVGLNSFRAGGNVAYSYKLNDYILSGLLVANSLPGEAAAMIRDAGLGATYEAGDPESLLAQLRSIHARWLANPRCGTQGLDFAARKLDRSTIYEPMISACLNGPREHRGL